jgi:hypothetical protein
MAFCKARLLKAAEKFGTGQDWQGLKSMRENSVLEGHGFSRAVNSFESFRALAPEGIFYQRTREFGGWKKRTSAASMRRLGSSTVFLLFSLSGRFLSLSFSRLFSVGLRIHLGLLYAL